MVIPGPNATIDARLFSWQYSFVVPFLHRFPKVVS